MFLHTESWARAAGPLTLARSAVPKRGPPVTGERLPQTPPRAQVQGKLEGERFQRESSRARRARSHSVAGTPAGSLDSPADSLYAEHHALAAPFPHGAEVGHSRHFDAAFVLQQQGLADLFGGLGSGGVVPAGGPDSVTATKQAASCGTATLPPASPPRPGTPGAGQAAGRGAEPAPRGSAGGSLPPSTGGLRGGQQPPWSRRQRPYRLQRGSDTVVTLQGVRGPLRARPTSVALSRSLPLLGPKPRWRDGGDA